MRKKGFTLIELIAVIVILGILSLIAVPIVFNQLNKAREDAYRASVRSVFDSVATYLARNDQLEGITPLHFNIPDSSEYKQLGLKNADFTSGYIYRDKDGILMVKNISNGIYCASGSKNDLRVTKGECDAIDITPPIITIHPSRITSNSIRVSVNAYDEESGITNFKYYLNDELINESRDNVYTFSNLKPDTEYTIKVVVVNNSQNKEHNTSEAEGVFKTTVRDISMKAIPTGWAHSKTVTIVFAETVSNNENYRYMLNGNGNWIDAVDNKVDILITEDTTILAQVLENGKVVSELQKLFGSIDNEGPVIKQIVGNEPVWKTTANISILAKDAGVGIDSYSFDGGVTWRSIKDYGNEANKMMFSEQQKITVCVKDLLGNVSEYKDVFITYIDNNIPKNVTIDASINEGVTYGEHTTGKWTNKNIILRANHEPSKTASGFTYQWYKLVNDKYVPLTGATGKTLKLTSEGTNSFKVEVGTKAGAGPIASQNIFVTKIDKTLPTTTMPASATSWKTGTRTFSALCLDKDSGCTSTTAKKEWKFTESTNTATIKYTVTDEAGNSNYYTKVINVLLDNSKPSLSIGSIVSSTSKLTIGYEVGDEHSGVKDVYVLYRKQDSSNGTSSSSSNSSKVSCSNGVCTLNNLSENTTYYYEIIATDKVGNSRNVGSNSKSGTIGFEYSLTPNTLCTKSKTVKINYITSNVTSPTYYIKTTKNTTSNVNTISSCGTGTDPSTNCATAKTKNLVANTWYKVPSSINITFTSDGNIYTKVNDGDKYLNKGFGTLTVNIDENNPKLTIGNISKTTSSIKIPYTVTDTENCSTTVVCEYGLTNNQSSSSSGSSYSNKVTCSNGECNLSSLSADTTYYYKITATDSSGNSTIEYGNTKTGKGTVKVTPNGNTSCVKSRSISVDYTTSNITKLSHYVKSTTDATSSVTLAAKCGSSANPGSCTTVSTTSMSAGEWYKVSGDVNVTVNSDSIVYAMINDGVAYVASANATASVDKTLPKISVNKVTTTTSTATIEYSGSDSCGIDSVIVTYQKQNSSTNNDSSISSSSATNLGTISCTNNKCVIDNLESGTKYDYVLTATDGSGNTNNVDGNFNTGAASCSFSTSSTSSCVRNKNVTPSCTVSNITPTYYVKSSVQATSNISLKAKCGSSTDPGSCTTLSSGIKNMEADVWYKVTSVPTLTYFSSGIMYVKINDGNRYLSAFTKTVTVDNENPTITKKGKVILSSAAETATVKYTVTDDCDTTVKCSYGTSDYNKKGKIKNNSCVMSSITSGSSAKTYKYKLVATDEAGNTDTFEGSFKVPATNDTSTSTDVCTWYADFNTYAKTDKYTMNTTIVFSSANCTLKSVMCEKGEEKILGLHIISGALYTKSLSISKKSDLQYTYSTGRAGDGVIDCVGTFSDGSESGVSFRHVPDTGIKCANCPDTRTDCYWYFTY